MSETLQTRLAPSQKRNRRRRRNGRDTQAHVQSSQQRHTARQRSPMDPHDLAAAFVTQRCSDDRGRLTIRYWNGDWWRWDGKRYRKAADDEFDAELNAFLRAELDRRGNYTTRVVNALVSNVSAAFRATVILPSDFQQPCGLGPLADKQLLALENGLLDIEAAIAGKDNCLLPHSPDWFSAVALPYKYDPQASCPRWEAHLGWMFQGDEQTIALMQEWAGYCFTSDVSQHKFVLLVGEGANGKGVFLRVLEAAVGRENVAHISPETLRDRFGLADLPGKLMNICGDVDVSGIDEGRLKALTGEDPITVDRKHKAPMTLRNTAKFIFATNNPPRFRDKTEGLWRRMYVVRCDARVEGERNPKLTEELTQELSGIFNWALAGLTRLRTVGEFTSCKAVNEATSELRLENDPAGRFLMERCAVDSTGSVLTSELQAEFGVWGVDQGVRVTGEELGRAVRRVFCVEKQRRSAKLDPQRPYEYRGIRLMS